MAGLDPARQAANHAGAVWPPAPLVPIAAATAMLGIRMTSRGLRLNRQLRLLGSRYIRSGKQTAGRSDLRQ